MTRASYVLGGGGEFSLNESWSVSGEYLLARFDDTEFSFPSARTGVMIANGSGYPVTSNVVNGRKLISKVDIPMVKVGVNYRF